MYIIMFIVKRDELRDTEDEVKVLENLLLSNLLHDYTWIIKCFYTIPDLAKK